MGESFHVIVLDTFVAVIAGVIMSAHALLMDLKLMQDQAFCLIQWQQYSLICREDAVGCVVLLVYGICSDVYRARCL